MIACAAWGHHGRVTLDGEELPLCFFADDEQGVAYCYADSRDLDENGNPVWVKRRGKVQIEIIGELYPEGVRALPMAEIAGRENNPFRDHTPIGLEKLLIPSGLPMR